jgi:hypothetical protein
MKYLKYLMIIIVAVIFIVTFSKGVILERRLDDCHFEYNHLQTKLIKLEELNNYIPAMEQVLNPLQLAELKTITEMIRQEKYKAYEGKEMPLIER